VASASTFGKAPSSGKPRKAPKVSIPSKDSPNYMKESDNKLRRKSKMWPLKIKRTSP